jgi:hypothetical protein
LHALLAGEPNLLSDNWTLEGAVRNDKHNVFKRGRAYGFLDLAPPVVPTSQANEVLPDGEARLF